MLSKKNYLLHIEKSLEKKIKKAMLNTQRYLLLSAAAATVSERISLVGIWKRNKIEKFFKKYVVKNFGTKLPLQFKTSENHTRFNVEQCRNCDTTSVAYADSQILIFSHIGATGIYSSLGVSL